jgi:hypothetical protein
MMSCIPKGVYKWVSHNPNSRFAPNYSIVEDLSQTLCAMSSLEVLQSFPSKYITLLSTIEVGDSSSQLTMNFDVTDVNPPLNHHVSFQIDIFYEKHVIRKIIVDEGDSMCVMYLSCWKSIGSLELTPSPTFLTTFDEISFRSHDLISSFPVHLGRNIISIEVEVSNALLDYNLLLGGSWNYVMTILISSIFQILCFPHEGRIVTIDHMVFNHSIFAVNQGSMVPWISNSQLETKSIGVGMCPSLMGNFNTSIDILYLFHPSWISRFESPVSSDESRVI